MLALDESYPQGLWGVCDWSKREELHSEDCYTTLWWQKKSYYCDSHSTAVSSKAGHMTHLSVRRWDRRLVCLYLAAKNLYRLLWKWTNDEKVFVSARIFNFGHWWFNAEQNTENKNDITRASVKTVMVAVLWWWWEWASKSELGGVCGGVEEEGSGRCHGGGYCGRRRRRRRHWGHGESCWGGRGPRALTSPPPHILPGKVTYRVSVMITSHAATRYITPLLVLSTVLFSDLFLWVLIKIFNNYVCQLHLQYTLLSLLSLIWFMYQAEQ